MILRFWAELNDRPMRTPSNLILSVLHLIAWVMCLAKTVSGHGLPCNENLDEPLPFLKAVLLSEVILYGRIRNKYPDPRYLVDVYTAEMEVFCVIKGAQTNRILNITGAGLVPGICFSTSLNVGSNYVLLVESDGHSYRPVDSEKPGTESVLEEVVKACHIDPKYPFGVSESIAEFKCPVSSLRERCTDLSYFTTTTTTTTTETPTPPDDYDYLTDGPLPPDADPFEGDLPHQASSNSPQLITSIFSTTSKDYHAILSARLLPVITLTVMFKVLGECLIH